MTAPVVTSLLFIAVFYWLVPKDGNVARGALLGAFLAVLLRVQAASADRSAAPKTSGQAAESEGQESASPPPGGAAPMVRTVVGELRTSRSFWLLLAILLLTVLAAVAPRTWYDVTWLSVARHVVVGASLVGWCWVLVRLGRKPAAAEPEFKSAADRRLHLWRQVWPFGLVVSVPIGYGLGILVIRALFPVWPSGGGPRAITLVLWTAAFALVFWRVIRRLERDAPPRSAVASAWTPAPRSTVGPEQADRMAQRAKIMRAPPTAPHVDRAVSRRAAPVDRDGGGLLTWDSGTKRRVVHTSAQLHAEVLRLHLSTVTLPRHADFTPESGMTVRIRLGEERSVLVTDPDDLRRQSVVTMDGLQTFWVAFADTRVHVYPPEAYLPVELAMEILRRYCATGALPGTKTA
ncbi:hypothetical protein [Catellatospora vulcania]|uniref:hypothetical protein n=1 Tax=Catellatospora vulcania TaxID=1460450 RepID=UPI0012D4C25C|nr:hypothetical protein [Catellatospora vulcania]